VYSWNGAEVPVVDADSHVVEPPGAWDAYISKAYRDRVPRLVRDGETDWLHLEGERFFSYGMVRGLVAGDSGFPDAHGPAAGRWDEDILPGAYAVGPRLADMDRDGIDQAVVYPTVSMGLFNVADRALARELANAYNRWIADFCATCPDRLNAVGVVIPSDPDQAAADLALCRELGHVQVLVPLQADGKDLGDPFWEPIWERANALGMPVGAHAFSGRRNAGAARSDTLVEALIERTAEVERALVSLVFGGVLDRFAGLRFVSVENEAGWAASLINRADVSYARGRKSTERLRGCARRPSEVFCEQIFFTFIHDQTAIDARRVIGESNVMWSTDYPHNSSTWPNSRDHLGRQLRPELSLDEVRGLVGGNARGLYTLDPVRVA
jgi:predicted TIM-barrel fold metal-dependent hydrolase